jgi:hypothetical protein
MKRTASHAELVAQTRTRVVEAVEDVTDGRSTTSMAEACGLEMEPDDAGEALPSERV